MALLCQHSHEIIATSLSLHLQTNELGTLFVDILSPLIKIYMIASEKVIFT